jgi:predicted NBD/HSP70 family sugar kinase
LLKYLFSELNGVSMRGVTFTTRGALNKSALRQANERLVLNGIRQNPSVSRADIVRLTGLSPSSVTYIVKRLGRNKMILEQEVENQSQVGRRPTALRLRPEARMALGVEITRPESRVGVADLNGEIVRTKTLPWHPNPELFFDRVHSAIRVLSQAMEPGQLLGVGVGLPGTIDRASGRVIAAENFKWFGVEAGRLLRGRLGIPFYYENSAKLAALAEMWSSGRDGPALQNFVFIAAHGGLGTGVIINGQLFQGAYSAAAEFGHTILYPDGRRCPCGNTGCWEQYASDLALCRLYADLSQQDSRGEIETEALDIVRMARDGDPIAQRAVQETAQHLGLGFVNLIWALNPEAIVVGDWLAEAWDLAEETVWSVVRSRVAGYNLSGLRMIPARHRADSSFVGAFALVLSRFFHSFDHGQAHGRSHSVVMASA